MLGVKPQLGRVYTQQDAVPGGRDTIQSAFIYRDDRLWIHPAEPPCESVHGLAGKTERMLESREPARIVVDTLCAIRAPQKLPRRATLLGAGKVEVERNRKHRRQSGAYVGNEAHERGRCAPQAGTGNSDKPQGNADEDAK